MSTWKTTFKLSGLVLLTLGVVLFHNIVVPVSASGHLEFLRHPEHHRRTSFFRHQRSIGPVSGACDRHALSVCYNQLQPFMLTNQLRRVLRRLPSDDADSSGDSRLSTIFSEFRDFCSLFSTFVECLDAYNASSPCLNGNPISSSSSINAVSVIGSSSRSSSSLRRAASDLARDFDHFRRVALSFCIETPEHLQIHIVRCMSEASANAWAPLPAIPSSSFGKAAINPFGASSRLSRTLNAAPPSPGVFRSCIDLMHTSGQTAMLTSIFKQSGCGQHIEPAIRLSSFLAELTMAATKPEEATRRFGCVRSLPAVILQNLVNDTFYGANAAMATTTPSTQPPPRMETPIGSLLLSPISVDDLLLGTSRSRPVISRINNDNRFDKLKPDDVSTDVANDDGMDDGYDFPGEVTLSSETIRLTTISVAEPQRPDSTEQLDVSLTADVREKSALTRESDESNSANQLLSKPSLVLLTSLVLFIQFINPQLLVSRRLCYHQHQLS